MICALPVGLEELNLLRRLAFDGDDQVGHGVRRDALFALGIILSRNRDRLVLNRVGQADFLEQNVQGGSQVHVVNAHRNGLIEVNARGLDRLIVVDDVDIAADNFLDVLNARAERHIVEAKSQLLFVQGALDSLLLGIFQHRFDDGRVLPIRGAFVEVSINLRRIADIDIRARIGIQTPQDKLLLIAVGLPIAFFLLPDAGLEIAALGRQVFRIQLFYLQPGYLCFFELVLVHQLIGLIRQFGDLSLGFLFFKGALFFAGLSALTFGSLLFLESSWPSGSRTAARNGPPASAAPPPVPAPNRRSPG